MGSFKSINKMETKTLNKSATIQNILDKANRAGNGTSIDIAGFNEKLKEEGDSFLIEAANFLGVHLFIIKFGD